MGSLYSTFLNLFGRSGTERSTNAAVVSATVAAIGILFAVAALTYSAFVDKDVNLEARGAATRALTEVIDVSNSLTPHVMQVVKDTSALNSASTSLEMRVTTLEAEIDRLKRELQAVMSIQQSQTGSK